MSVAQEARYAVRQMRQKPGFAIVAILTLALGIGANTAIYSLLDQALLRRLPVQQPERLVMLRYFGSNTGHVSSYGGDDKNYFSYPMYRDVRDRNSVFAGAIATDVVQVGVRWRNQPAIVSGELVSGNYFEVFGAFVLARLMDSLLYQIPPRDPVTYLGVCVILALVAIAASYVPALRATRVDPMVALRYE
jgi:putative ABC transport system permease protein